MAELMAELKHQEDLTNNTFRDIHVHAEEDNMFSYCSIGKELGECGASQKDQKEGAEVEK